MSTLARNAHTPVDASAGPVSMALPTVSVASGDEVSAEKYDATTNLVTITGSIRGVAAQKITLSLPKETVGFRADSSGSWWPISGHKTLGSLNTLWRNQWARDAFLPPLPFDLPEVSITAASTTAFASPVIAAPPVLGIGSRTTSWDGASDTAIRYGGGPGATTTFNTANGPNQDLALYSNLKPGGVSQAAGWAMIYEFATAAPCVEIQTYHTVADSFMVEVNGALISERAMRQQYAAGYGRINLAFPAPGLNGATRTIRVFAGPTHGLVAIRVPTGYTITKPPARSNTIAVVGDSWVNGASDIGQLDSFAAGLLRLIDPQADVIYAGIGGTGWTVATDTGGGSNAYSTRMSAVLASNPSVLVLYGSQNDGNTDVGSAVASVLSTASAVPKIIVIPTLLAGYPVQVASVAAATAAAGRTYLGAVAGLIQGSGYVDAPVSLAGNRSLFVYSAGNLHMTPAGHRFVRQAVYNTIPDIVIA